MGDFIAGIVFAAIMFGFIYALASGASQGAQFKDLQQQIATGKYIYVEDTPFRCSEVK